MPANPSYHLLEDKNSFLGYKVEEGINSVGKKFRIIRLPNKPQQPLVLKNLPDTSFTVAEHHVSLYEEMTLKKSKFILAPFHHTLQYNNGLKVRVYYGSDGKYCGHLVVKEPEGTSIHLEDDEAYRIRRDSELHVKSVINEMLQDLKNERKNYKEQIEKSVKKLTELSESEEGVNQPAYLAELEKLTGSEEAIGLFDKKNKVSFRPNISLKLRLLKLKADITANLRAKKTPPAQPVTIPAQPMAKQNSSNKNRNRRKKVQPNGQKQTQKNKEENLALTLQRRAKLEADFDTDIQNQSPVEIYQKKAALIEEMWKTASDDVNYIWKTITEKEKRLDAMRQEYILEACHESDDIEIVGELLNLEKDALLLQKLEAIAHDYERPNLLEFLRQKKLQKTSPHFLQHEDAEEKQAQPEEDILEKKYPIEFYKPSFTLFESALATMDYAQQCLTVCSYLAPEISISFFKQIMPNQFSYSSQRIDEILKFLEKFESLKINSGNSTISINPSVQERAWRSLETDSQKRVCSLLLERLADILSDKYEYKESKEAFADTVRSLEPHLKSIIHHYRQICPDLFSISLGSVSFCLADFYQKFPDKQQESYHYYSLSLKAIEENAGKNTIDSAIALQKLVRICHNLNKLEEKREYLSRALAIEEELYGHASPRLIITLANLSSTYSMLKENSLTLETVRRIREISKTTNNPLSEKEQKGVDTMAQLFPEVFSTETLQKSAGAASLPLMPNSAEQAIDEKEEREPKKPAAAKPAAKSPPTLDQFKNYSNPLVYPILLFCTHLTPKEISVSLLTKLVNQYQLLQNKNSGISEDQLEITLNSLNKQKYLNYDNANKSILAPQPAKKLITNSSLQQQREYLESVQNTLGEIKKLDMGTARDYADRLMQVKSNLERAEKKDQDEKSAQQSVPGAVPLAPNSAQFAARYGVLPEPAGLGPASPRPPLPLDAGKGPAPQQH